MTDEQVIAYLQSIAIQAVELQTLVSAMNEEEREMVQEVDHDLDSLLDYLAAPTEEHPLPDDEDPTRFPYQEA